MRDLSFQSTTVSESIYAYLDIYHCMFPIDHYVKQFHLQDIDSCEGDYFLNQLIILRAFTETRPKMQ